VPEPGSLDGAGAEVAGRVRKTAVRDCCGRAAGGVGGGGRGGRAGGGGRGGRAGETAGHAGAADRLDLFCVIGFGVGPTVFGVEVGSPI
jgi:hypothetical protein